MIENWWRTNRGLGGENKSSDPTVTGRESRLCDELRGGGVSSPQGWSEYDRLASREL